MCITAPLFNIPVFKNVNNCDKLSQAFLLANSTKSSQAFEYLRITQKPTTVVGLIDKAFEIARSGENLLMFYVTQSCQTIIIFCSKKRLKMELPILSTSAISLLPNI